jgi:hypothetical protein
MDERRSGMGQGEIIVVEDDSSQYMTFWKPFPVDCQVLHQIMILQERENQSCLKVSK